MQKLTEEFIKTHWTPDTQKRSYFLDFYGEIIEYFPETKAFMRGCEWIYDFSEVEKELDSVGYFEKVSEEMNKAKFLQAVHQAQNLLSLSLDILSQIPEDTDFYKTLEESYPLREPLTTTIDKLGQWIALNATGKE